MQLLTEQPEVKLDPRVWIVLDLESQSSITRQIGQAAEHSQSLRVVMTPRKPVRMYCHFSVALVLSSSISVQQVHLSAQRTAIHCARA